jgi:hypothetical protein
MELDQHEKQLEGAPEGELFMVQILTRKEIFPSKNPQEELKIIIQVLGTLKQHIVRADAGADTTDAIDSISTTTGTVTIGASNSLSWGKEFEAIDSLRRFILHHLELIQPYL